MRQSGAVYRLFVLLIATRLERNSCEFGPIFVRRISIPKLTHDATIGPSEHVQLTHFHSRCHKSVVHGRRGGCNGAQFQELAVLSSM